LGSVVGVRRDQARREHVLLQRASVPGTHHGPVPAQKLADETLRHDAPWPFMTMSSATTSISCKKVRGEQDGSDVVGVAAEQVAHPADPGPYRILDTGTPNRFRSVASHGPRRAGRQELVRDRDWASSHGQTPRVWYHIWCESPLRVARVDSP
jgi:hypothetical protein